MVSLGSQSSVEYGINKIFEFSFFIGSYRGFKLCEKLLFLFTFSVFLTKFLSILLKYVKTVNCTVNDFVSKDKVGLLSCSIRVFCL